MTRSFSAGLLPGNPIYPRCRILPLAWVTIMNLMLAGSSSLSRLLLMAAVPSSMSADLPNLMSSANWPHLSHLPSHWQRYQTRLATGLIPEELHFWLGIGQTSNQWPFQSDGPASFSPCSMHILTSQFEYKIFLLGCSICLLLNVTLCAQENSKEHQYTLWRHDKSLYIFLHFPLKKNYYIKQRFILGMLLWKVTLEGTKKSQSIYNGSRFSQQDAAELLNLQLQFWECKNMKQNIREMKK